MAQDDAPALERPPLYDRLGGVYNIATVVQDLIDRVMLPAAERNPRVDEAHHRVSAAGFKFLVTELACQAAGGPQQYSGRPMGDSHRHLRITPEEWQAFMDDVQQALDKIGVPQPEQDELKAIVESTGRRSWSRRCRRAVSVRRAVVTGDPEPPAMTGEPHGTHRRQQPKPRARSDFRSLVFGAEPAHQTLRRRIAPESWVGAHVAMPRQP